MPFILIQGTFHLVGRTQAGNPTGFEPDGDAAVSSSAPSGPATTAPPSTPGPTTTGPRASRPLVLTEGGLGGLASFGEVMDQVVYRLTAQLGPPDQTWAGAPRDGRPEPATRRGIQPGSTGAELRAADGHQVRIFPIEASAGTGFRTGPRGGPAVESLLTSSAAAGRVTHLHGGQGCGE